MECWGLKNTMTEMNNLRQGFDSRLDKAEERTNHLENRATEIV